MVHPSRAHHTEDGLIPAAAYIRVSSDHQAENYSPEVQRAGIARAAAQQGYALALVEQDVEKGRVVSRKGYQAILDAVAGGTIHAVLVYKFDRWGRDGSEWIKRAAWLERHYIPFISVQEGREEGGLMRFVRAGMAEEYSRNLGRTVRPAKEAAARKGRHVGITPYGYLRRYDAPDGRGRRGGGDLVPDPRTAPVVQRIFARFLEGASLRRIAMELNADPTAGPAAKGALWSVCLVRYILTNPTYAGQIRYNTHSLGFYDRCAPGSEFIVPGQHLGLVSPEDFAAAAALRAASTPNRARARVEHATPLGAGLLRCNGCGALMVRSARPDGSTRMSSYFCGARRQGDAGCAEPGYQMPIADAALLDQIARLRAASWDPARIDARAGADSALLERKAAERALAAAQEQMRRHVRRHSDLPEEPTEEEEVAHREVGLEIAARIRAAKAAAEALPAQAETPPLAALHERLASADLGALAARGLALDSPALRDLVLALVAEARVVRRIPSTKARWLEVQVTWTADVQILLDAGLLHLAPAPAAPDIPETPEGRRLANARRSEAKRRAAGKVGTPVRRMARSGQDGVG